MKELNGQRISFNQLINETNWAINIPMIQRDFAYGRENQKVAATEFVESLFTVMTKLEEDCLDLNFIYGSTNNSDEFIVIDGQQRLTVLFLLHWYTEGLQGRFTEFKKVMLDKDGKTRFHYLTRASSSEFTNAILESISNLENLIENAVSGENLKEQIKNQPWFLKSWLSDPTVIAMLSLIEIIHNVSLKKQLKDKTIHYDRVMFQILDIKSYSLTDELYIKMNARGKPLSSWQNFKAYLYEFISDKKINIRIDDWDTALDKRWLDLFWEHTDNKENVEENLLNFFINQLIYQYTSDKIELNDKILNQLLNNTDISIVIFCKKNNLLSDEYLNRCFQSLETLYKIDFNVYNRIEVGVLYEHFTKHTLKKFLFNNYNKKTGLYDRVYFNSVLVGLRLFNENNIPLNDPVTERWMRVTRNLIFNQNIDNNLRLFRALKSISKIEKSKIFNIDEYSISELKSGFTITQINDELEKRKHLNSKDNKELIYKLEDHYYLYGQINFLLEMAKINDEVNFSFVKKYGERLCLLIDKNSQDNNFLLQRALLTKGFYFGIRSANHTLCLWTSGSARDRNENWRTVFNNEEKRSFLKELLDDERTLPNILKISKVKNWRQLLINEPKLYRYSSQGLIRKISDKNIRILKTTSIGGSQGELKSLSLYYDKFKDADIKIFAPFTNKSYHTSVGQSSLPCVFLDNWELEDGSNHALDIFNKFDEGFYFHFFNRNGEISEPLKTVLMKADFTVDEENKYFLKVSESEVYNKLMSVLETLKTLN